MRLITALFLLAVSLPAPADDKLPAGAVAKAGKPTSYWRQYPAVVSADGKTLAVRVDGGFDLVDLGTGKTVELRDDTGKRVLPARTTRDSGDTMLAFALDGKTVVTANQDKCVSVWDAATGKHLRDVDMPKQEDNGSGLPPDPRLPAYRVFASSHMKAFVVIGAGGLFTLNAKDEFTKLQCFDGGLICHVTSNGRWIASAESMSAIEDNFGVTDVSKPKAIDDARGHFGGSVGVNRYAGRVCTSDDGRFVAVNYWNGGKENGFQLHRYDGTGEVKLDAATGDAFRDAYAVGFNGNATAVYCVLKDKIAVWDTTTGKRGANVKMPVKDGAVLFDPPRDRAILCGGGHVYVVDLKK